LEKGDNILVCDLEYQASTVCWKPRIYHVGAELREVKSVNGAVTAADFEAVMDSHTKAIMLASVQEINGYRADVKAITELCHSRGIYVAIDGVQEVGAMKVNVHDLGVDFYTAGAKKWIGNPFGTGFLYIRRELISQLDPMYYGYFSMKFPDKFPDYVSYLMNKRTLSITAINEILQQIPPDKKLGKDQRMLERLYMDYQKNEYDDSNAVARLAELLADKNILMLGPGASVESEAQTIRNFVHTESPVVVSINYIPRLVKADYLFLTNSKRYLEMSGMLTEEEPVPIVATSNVTKNGGVFPFVVNYSSLIDTEAEFPDNSMIMLLKLLETLGVGSVTLAGFDGYTPDNINYFNKKMEYSFVKEKSASLNAYANQFLAEYKRRVNISFLTKTLYLQ
jgi:hypothetical protein